MNTLAPAFNLAVQTTPEQQTPALTLMAAPDKVASSKNKPLAVLAKVKFLALSRSVEILTGEGADEISTRLIIPHGTDKPTTLKVKAGYLRAELNKHGIAVTFSRSKVAAALAPSPTFCRRKTESICSPAAVSRRSPASPPWR